MTIEGAGECLKSSFITSSISQGVGRVRWHWRKLREDVEKDSDSWPSPLPHSHLKVYWRVRGISLKSMFWTFLLLLLLHTTVDSLSPPPLEGECENTRSIHVGRSVARNWEVAPAARVGAALGRRRQVSFPPSRRDWRFLWIDKVNVGGCIESYKTHACSLISPP